MSRLNWDERGARLYVRHEARAFLLRVCLMIVARAKEILSVPGTGRVGGRRSGPVTHARPGEPPRKQTGRLRASVTYELDARDLAGRVGTNVDYGRHLELGTRRGLLPRPWLRPAVSWVLSQLS